MVSKGIWKAALTPYGFCILAGNIKTAVAERYFDLKPTAKELKKLHDNARLIAAAPETARERDKLKEINAELLEACKEAQKAIYEAINNRPATLGTIWHTLDDAITKAGK